MHFHPYNPTHYSTISCNIFFRMFLDSLKNEYL